MLKNVSSMLAIRVIKKLFLKYLEIIRKYFCQNDLKFFSKLFFQKQRSCNESIISIEASEICVKIFIFLYLKITYMPSTHQDGEDS